MEGIGERMSEYKRINGEWHDLSTGEIVNLKEYAKGDIQHGDFEKEFFVKRNHKRRNCVFCGRNIKGREIFYRNFPYPYVTYPSWFCCRECFEEKEEKAK